MDTKFRMTLLFPSSGYKF